MRNIMRNYRGVNPLIIFVVLGFCEIFWYLGYVDENKFCVEMVYGNLMGF